MKLILRLQRASGEKEPFRRDEYPPAEFILIVKPDEGAECGYRLHRMHSGPAAKANRQPRGIFLRADFEFGQRTCGIPDQFVVRFPDLGPFFNLSEQTRLARLTSYNQQFAEEIASEAQLLRCVSLDPARPAAGIIPEDRKEALWLEAEFQASPGKVSLPVSFREYIEGDPLSRYCLQRANTLPDSFTGLPAADWFRLAEELIKVVHRLHLGGAPHGYICPSNVIVTPVSEEGHEQLRLVNFERDLPDPSLLVDEHADALGQGDWSERAKLMWRRPYDSPERACCYHNQARRPEIHDPFVPGDLYSVGLTLLWMASGGHPINPPLTPFVEEKPWRELPWNRVTNRLRHSDRAIKLKIRSLLEKRVEAEEWDAASGAAATEIIFACLRLESHRFYNMRGVLEEFRQQRPPYGAAGVSRINEMTRQLRQAIQSTYRKAPIVENLYCSRLDRVLLPFGDDEVYRRFTVGTRGEMIDTLVSVFSQLGIGEGQYSRCKAVTTPGFFSNENCTSGGRVVSAIIGAVDRGAEIQWRFVISESRLNAPEVIDVMINQRSNWGDRLNQGPSSVRWLPMTSWDFKKFLREKGPFIHCAGPSGMDDILILPDFAAEPGQMIALRVFPVSGNEGPVQERGRRLLDWFHQEKDSGYALDRFHHSLSVDEVK